MKNDKFNFYDNKKIRAACLVSPSTDVTSIVNSTQAPSRHIEGSTQCCFVPNLTRFVDSYCVRPRYQRHLQRAALQKATRNKTITSAIADCRKRVPLPPRLARKLYDLIIFGILDLRCIFDYTKQLSQGQQLLSFLINSIIFLLCCCVCFNPHCKSCRMQIIPFISLQADITLSFRCFIHKSDPAKIVTVIASDECC